MRARGRRSGLQGKNLEPANFENRQWLDTEGRERRRVDGKVYGWCGWRYPVLAPKTLDTRHDCGEGLALLGDAAGFADPVTGEGIYYALRSAEVFADCYLRGAPLEYESCWREDFGGELQRASQMRQR